MTTSIQPQQHVNPVTPVAILTSVLLSVALCTIGTRNSAGQDAMPVSQEKASHEMTPKETELWELEPRVIDPGDGRRPPSDAIVLFDGTDLSGWTGENGPAVWTVSDGVLTVTPGAGGISTTRSFGDVQLHVEWRTPAEVNGHGQGRGNSGVFLMGLYEVQVLDSYRNRTYSNGQAGAVYKQHIPLVNASRPPGVWQVYDIVFRRPRFTEDGRIAHPATLTVFHNGVLIQDRVDLLGPTKHIGLPWYQPHADKLPLMLQDHGNLVSYRNIWLREL